MGPIMPEVSIEMGTNVNLSSSDLYFVCFVASAEQDFEPGKAADEDRAEGEKVSEQVATHARHTGEWKGCDAIRTLSVASIKACWFKDHVHSSCV